MQREGSITVFAALSMMLIASFLFALLEAGRVYGLHACAEQKTGLGIESVCAEYQTGLYAEYKLLCLDGAYGKETFSIENVEKALCHIIRKNLKTEDGIDFFRMEVEEAKVEEYQLLTDAKGQVFIHMLSSYMKEKLAGDVLEAILTQYNKNGETAQDTRAQDGVEKADAAIAEAKKAKEDAEKAEQEENADKKIQASESKEIQDSENVQKDTIQDSEGVSEEVEGIKENPLDIVLELKRNTILGLVIEDISGLSEQKADFSDCISKRTLLEGNAQNKTESSFIDKCLAVEYLGDYFSDYVHSKEGHMFVYELEYVLCGKESDKANLEAAVNRLLLLRQSANFLHIVQDAAKWKEAFAVATALAGFSGNPVVIQVVQVGIAAAWAFIESIQDIRALLQGDRIALMKTNNEWTTDTSNLLASLTPGSKAKNCENGLTYQQYLKALIALENSKKLAYRSMDLMELNLQSLGYHYCKMDYMICSFTCHVSYGSASQFGQFLVLGNTGTDRYYFRKTAKFSYEL